MDDSEQGIVNGVEGNGCGLIQGILGICLEEQRKQMKNLN
jgi:hypothetical protein